MVVGIWVRVEGAALVALAGVAVAEGRSPRAVAVVTGLMELLLGSAEVAALVADSEPFLPVFDLWWCLVDVDDADAATDAEVVGPYVKDVSDESMPNAELEVVGAYVKDNIDESLLDAA